jgi:hypothetical protein
VKLDAEVLRGAYGPPDLKMRCTKGCALLNVWHMPNGMLMVERPGYSISAGHRHRPVTTPIAQAPDDGRVTVLPYRLGAVTTAHELSDLLDNDERVGPDAMGDVPLGCDHAHKVSWSFDAGELLAWLESESGTKVLATPTGDHVG